MDNLKGRKAEANNGEKLGIIARRRSQLRPFFFRMGSTALSVACVILISLMAVLYLSQLGQGVATNQQLQDVRSMESKIGRQNQDLLEQLAQERSPGYIATQARKQGLQPADPGDIQVITVRGLEPVPTQP